jgi:TolB-like protein
MKNRCLSLCHLIIPVILATQGVLHAQEMDKELSALANNLATMTKDNSKKKVTVLDFTDLQGVNSELGKYIAEQLTVDLVIAKNGFAVLDRANLKKILAEHKLTATGLVDPENSKKLGQFAGVDALILGTIVSKGQNIALTAKIITTDTAEIIGAAKTEFRSDETVQKLFSQQTSDPSSTDADTRNGEPPAIIKSFGDLQVVLNSLRIVNGHEYLLTLTLTNSSSKSILYAAVHYDDPRVKSIVRDPESYEFEAEFDDAQGLSMGYWHEIIGYQGKGVALNPKESTSGTIKYHTRGRQRPASPGLCKVQVEVLTLSVNGERKVVGVRPYNIIADMKAQ